MCGIIGFIAGRSFGKGSLSWTEQHQALNAYVTQMLYLDAFRGPHATGLMRVDKKNPKSEPFVHKRALHAFDFMLQPQVEQMLRNLDDAVCVVGHNRYATQGGAYPNKNAHPFQSGHITLVHNGHVTNMYQILKGKTLHEVDSANVCAALAELGWEQVLPNLKGAYSLVWHDAQEGTLNMVRNNERPMYWVGLGDADTPWEGVLFGSEMEMVTFVAKRTGIPIHDKFYYPPEHTLFKWSLDDPGKYTIHKFEAVKEAANSGPFPGAGTVVGGTATGTHTGTTRTSTTESDSNKSVRRATHRLRAEADLSYRQIIQFKCEGFTPYKNQRGEYGCLYGTAVTSGMAKPLKLGVEIHHIKKQVWNAYLKVRQTTADVPVRAINVKQGQRKKRVVAAEFVFNIEDWVNKKGQPIEQREEGTVVRTCRGPGNRLIPETYFNELVRGGCSHCGGNLDIADAQSIVWAGEMEKSPICAPCQRQLLDDSKPLAKGKLN